MICSNGATCPSAIGRSVNNLEHHCSAFYNSPLTFRPTLELWLSTESGRGRQLSASADGDILCRRHAACTNGGFDVVGGKPFGGPERLAGFGGLNEDDSSWITGVLSMGRVGGL